jgi:hypothetical protein
VKVEDTNALHFIFPDEIYLLDEDKPLYSISATPTPEIKTLPVSFNYLGSNKKNFVLLVHYPLHEFIQDDHLVALESILTAKKLSLEDVAIVNIAKQNVLGYGDIQSFFQAKTIVLLGKDALPEALPPAKLNVIEEVNGLKLLHTFSFDEMMDNNINKKAFWEQVKTL